jgi:hypothetical protein
VLGCNWHYLAVVKHVNKLIELNYYYHHHLIENNLLNTVSDYVKFVGYNLKISHCYHVSNCSLKTVFHITSLVGMFRPIITEIKVTKTTEHSPP